MGNSFGSGVNHSIASRHGGSGLIAKVSDDTDGEQLVTYLPKTINTQVSGAAYIPQPSEQNPQRYPFGKNSSEHDEV